MLHPDGQNTTTLKIAFSIIFQGERKKSNGSKSGKKQTSEEIFHLMQSVILTFTNQFH